MIEFEVLEVKIPMTTLPLPRQRWLAVAFTVLAVLVNFLWMGPGVILLNVGLGVALLIWISASAPADPGRASFWGRVAVGVQALHFGEETWGGFYRQFPALLDQSAWSLSRFASFNLAWLAAFLAAALAIRRGNPLARLILLFLGLVGGVANGVFHTGLALQQGRYFPGAITAPVAFVAGVLLLRALLGSSRSRPAPETA